MTLLKTTGLDWHRSSTWSLPVQKLSLQSGAEAALTRDRHNLLRTWEDFAFAAVEKGTEWKKGPACKDTVGEGELYINLSVFYSAHQSLIKKVNYSQLCSINVWLFFLLIKSLPFLVALTIKRHYRHVHFTVLPGSGSCPDGKSRIPQSPFRVSYLRMPALP